MVILYFVQEFFLVLVLTGGSAAGLFYQKDLKISGHQLEAFQKLTIVFFVAVITIWGTDTMSTLYWVAIPIALAVGGHAAFRKPVTGGASSTKPTPTPETTPQVSENEKKDQ